MFFKKRVSKLLHFNIDIDFLLPFLYYMLKDKTVSYLYNIMKLEKLIIGSVLSISLTLITIII